MTETTPAFLQGVLEEACEISLFARNTGDFYNQQVIPTFLELAKLTPFGQDYDPEVAYLQFLHPADVARKMYQKEFYLPRDPMIFQDWPATRAAIARMFEVAWREEILQACGVEDPAVYCQSFPCDADLARVVNEF